MYPYLINFFLNDLESLLFLVLSINNVSSLKNIVSTTFVFFHVYYIINYLNRKVVLSFFLVPQ